MGTTDRERWKLSAGFAANNLITGQKHIKTKRHEMNCRYQSKIDEEMRSKVEKSKILKNTIVMNEYKTIQLT